MQKQVEKFLSGKTTRKARSKLLSGMAIAAALTTTAFGATTAGDFTAINDSAVTDDGSFGDFYVAIISWIQGSLGYVIALLGMIGTLIVYAFTHKGAVLFIGMLLSFFVGGVVGISQTMFLLGTNSFDVAN